MDKVQFETGSDKLLPVSFPLLDQVAQVMLENAQIELIEIQGHTDSTGSAGINRKLSAARAEPCSALALPDGPVGRTSNSC